MPGASPKPRVPPRSRCTRGRRYSGTADWEQIALLKQHVRTIPVLGNGDIYDASDALAMMATTGCDGVVIGRGCLGRPWLFAELSAAFTGSPLPAPPDLAEVAQQAVAVTRG